MKSSRTLRAVLCALCVGAAGCSSLSGLFHGGGGNPRGVSDTEIGPMQVIVRRVVGARLFSAHLVVKGGVRGFSESEAGVAELAFRVAASGGTQDDGNGTLARRLSAIGATLSTSAGPDYATLAIEGPSEHFEEALSVLTDVFLRPALPEAEVALQRDRLLDELERDEEDPARALQASTEAALFDGHPYELRPRGTRESVARLDRAALAAFLGQQRQLSRLVAAVVGDVDPARVVDLLRLALGDLPRGEFRDEPLPRATAGSGSASPPPVGLQRKLPATLLRAVFPLPGWRDTHFPAALLAVAMLDDRVALSLRYRLGLSPDASASLDWGREIVTGSLIATTAHPAQAKKALRAEARRLREEPVTAAELSGAKAAFVTRWLTQFQSVDAQAGLLALAQTVGGDWHLAQTVQERVRAVSAKDVQTFARASLSKMQWGAEGTDVADTE